MPAPAPASIDELLARAARLAGRSLASIAAHLEVDVPADLRRHKGWIGSLIEAALGASVGNRSVPDCEAIGVELKTVPVDRRGRPRESTYVCTVSLADLDDLCWERSRVRAKLAHVLWVPIEAEPEIPLAHRRVGSPLLWEPEPDLEDTLRRDWEEHMAIILAGDMESITARRGTYLQIRPKAANAEARGLGLDEGGVPMHTQPRGFYLRALFVGEVLRRHFLLPGAE